MLTALGQVDFPVAGVLGLCEDDSVIGSAFFVMEMVEGRVFWDAHFPQVSRDERPAYFDAMNATIAQLHRIDPIAIGVGDFGKPGNYFARQISRWSRQYWEDTEAGRDADMDWVLERLPARIPADDETRIVHGDFRCDNLIFHPTQPQALGHPLADFVYHAMMYRMPPISNEEQYIAA